MPNKWLKIGGLVLSGVSMIVGIASDHIGRKNIVNDLSKSKELREMLAEEVAKQIAKNQ